MRRETEHSFSSGVSAPLAPSRQRATRGERIVIWIVSGLVVAGLVLGVSKHGQPLSPRARELFIPAGLMLLLLIGWSATRRGPDRSTLWFGLAALALIGIGAHEAASGPWTLLALPGAIIATFALLRAAVVGPDSAFFVYIQRQRRRDRPRSAAATRAWLVFGAVLTGFAGCLAVVRTARRAYSVAIAGRAFSVRCGATAGGAVHPVTLGLSAGRSYSVTIRPIEIRTGRGPRMGRSQRFTVSIPSADSKAWQTFP